VIFSFALLLLPEIQDSPPVKKKAPAEAPAEARQWWKNLSSEERREILERHQRYQTLSRGAKSEMRRRMDLVRSEIGDIRKSMDSDQQAKLEKMSEKERRKFLHQKVRPHFRDGAERMERRQPGAHDRFRHMAMEERFRQSAEILEKDRRGRVQQALHRAAGEGWIDEKIALGMKDMPLEEAMALLGQVHKQRFIRRATEKGFWTRRGISAEEKEALIELQPHEFFRRLGRAPGPPRHHGPGERDGNRTGEKKEMGKGAGKPAGTGEGRRPRKEHRTPPKQLRSGKF